MKAIDDILVNMDRQRHGGNHQGNWDRDGQRDREEPQNPDDSDKPCAEGEGQREEQPGDAEGHNQESQERDEKIRVARKMVAIAVVHQETAVEPGGAKLGELEKIGRVRQAEVAIELVGKEPRAERGGARQRDPSITAIQGAGGLRSRESPWEEAGSPRALRNRFSHAPANEQGNPGAMRKPANCPVA